MPDRFIDVVVEPHADLPDGCGVRFQAVRGEEPRPVSLIRYQPPVGTTGLFRVEGRGRDGNPVAAQVVSVESRCAGTSTLIWGGDRGLRLFHAPTADGRKPDGDGLTTTAEPTPCGRGHRLVNRVREATI